MDEPQWSPPDPTKLPPPRPPKAPAVSPLVRWWRARPVWQMVGLIVVGVIVCGIVLHYWSGGRLGP